MSNPMVGYVTDVPSDPVKVIIGPLVSFGSIKPTVNVLSSSDLGSSLFHPAALEERFLVVGVLLMGQE